MKLVFGTAALVAGVTVTGAATAKTFIDYLQPTPITCSPLSSATWGVAGVLPRDICNGIESAKGAGVPPDYFYWDGKIIRASDGTYHMFMSTWADSLGFNPGWQSSESYHATSSSVLGPYTRQGYVWSSGSHHGHNTSAAELLDGTYAVVVSEVVPFTIYTSSSLDGPWTACANPTGELIQTNGVNAGTDTHWDSNVSLVARTDGKFEIVQRHGLIAIANTICGPYLMQKPTWTYPTANLPSIDSIYPHRTSQPDPAITNPTYQWEEDPTIWYSGCRYHVLYQSSTDRIGYELSSPDGINNWRDGGLAYDPRMYTQIFGYVGSTTYTQWYKMERPGVLIENGHVTHVNWAVADVDKDTSIPAGSNHGSKIIVVPFDGVSFDADTGDCTSGGAAGTGGASSTGGSSTAGGAKATGGSSTAGGTRATGGSNSTGGAVATGGSVNSAGGTKATGGLAATGGAKATGGSTSASNTGGSSSLAATGGIVSTGGATNASGGAATATGGFINNSGGNSNGGQFSSGGALAVGGMQASGGFIGSTTTSTTDVGTTNTNDSSNVGGCGCRVADGRSHSKSLAMLGVFSLLILRSRKRRTNLNRLRPRQRGAT